MSWTHFDEQTQLDDSRKIFRMNSHYKHSEIAPEKDVQSGRATSIKAINGDLFDMSNVPSPRDTARNPTTTRLDMIVEGAFSSALWQMGAIKRLSRAGWRGWEAQEGHKDR